MKTFVYLFPPGLVVGLFAIFRLTGMSVPWLLLLAAAPWVFIAPFMAGRMERGTIRAVERLTRGMAQAAQRGS